MAKPIGLPQGKRKRLTLSGEWYDARLELHQRLARKLKNTLAELLSARGIQYDRVEARVKTRSQFLEKAAKKAGGRAKYSSPTDQIKDVVGVRVITYLDSTVAEVSALIESEFQVDPTNSLDKGEALGTDRVGYRSKHYVARLGERRAAFAEWADLKDIPCEIQIRSLLQHAWAEMEHDRRFKYPGELPDDIKRRFSLLAAQLEAADREFNNVAREIDERAARTAREASGPEAGDPLTIVNAAAYLRGVFANQIPSGHVDPGLGGTGGEELLDELTHFEIHTLGALASLVPKDFPLRYPEALSEPTAFIGLVRDAMILKDAPRYFANVWRNRRWTVMSRSDIDMFKKHHIPIDSLLATYGISSEEDFEEG